VHVVEMSSYQIDLAPSLDPSVGILSMSAKTISIATARWSITPR
jgi:UDP-N-acetylmuramoylalanine-D-glutamate ligase